MSVNRIRISGYISCLCTTLSMYVELYHQLDLGRTNLVRSIETLNILCETSFW